MTIKELLEETELGIRANIFIIDHENAVAALENEDDEELIVLYFLKTDGKDICVTREFVMDRNTTKIIFDESLKKEGVIVLEDKSGVSIYNYLGDEKLIIDNLITHVYTTYSLAFENSDEEPNFVENKQSKNGKYIIAEMSFNVEYPNINYGLITGVDKTRIYFNFYYGKYKDRTPIVIFGSLEDLYNFKKDEALLDLGEVSYMELIQESEENNSLLKAKNQIVKILEERLKVHRNCLILIEEAKARRSVGATTENASSFLEKIKLTLK